MGSRERVTSVKKRRNEKILRAIHPNVGIEVAYRRRLTSLVRQMAASYQYWLRATYRSNPPRMAQDESPAKELERLLKGMGVQWSKRFEEAAPRLARYFAGSTRRQSEAALRRILRESGITVKMTMTRGLRDVLNAVVADNVALIKSIPQQYHTQVEGLVMRSVTEGRDLEQLTRDLRDRFGVTERRARFIALDQSNKATSAIRREREMSVGLEDAIWLHSAAGKEPRPTHVANSGKRFSLSEGWYDPAVRKRIWPGTEPRCRCTWRVVVKGFS
jgi:SPP1 gp7 family putative phage head morphogenesis protein